jgi:hypothetical protein
VHCSVLRHDIQAQIESTTIDLRDLNTDGWITDEDVALIQRFMMRKALFYLDSDFSVLTLQTPLSGDAVLDQERLEPSS